MKILFIIHNVIDLSNISLLIYIAIIIIILLLAKNVSYIKNISYIINKINSDLYLLLYIYILKSFN